MYCLYILRSLKNSAYYIGSSKDISIRLANHNSGKVRSTKRSAPWELIYSETYNTLSDARKRELQIKSWKKRRAIESLINRGSTTIQAGP